MRQVGEISHIAGSGRLIVRLDAEIGEGAILYGRQGTRLAKIQEIMGPVSRPFASASVMTNNARRLKGAVYTDGKGR